MIAQSVNYLTALYSINSSRIYEYTSTLITRLKHLSESEQGDFFDKTSFSSIDDYIRDIIGVSQLLNIDISNLDDTATEVVTKVFSKMLFDYLRALSPRNSMPINLILEEAHRFVRSDMDCNGVQREHNKKLNNGLPILHKVPSK